MGLIALPSSGIVYLDTATIIYSVEKHIDYWHLLHPLWTTSKIGQFEIATSEFTLLEALVGPLKSGNSNLVSDYESLLSGTEIETVSVTTSVLREAAKLRAQINLKAPDSIHAATALQIGCAMFVTNDAEFRRINGLNVVVLKDLLVP